MFGGSPDSAQCPSVPAEPHPGTGTSLEWRPPSPDGIPGALPSQAVPAAPGGHRTPESPLPSARAVLCLRDFPSPLLFFHHFPAFPRTLLIRSGTWHPLLPCLSALLPLFLQEMLTRTQPLPVGAVTVPAGNYSRCKVGGRRREATFAALSAVVRFSPFDRYFFPPSSLSSPANVLRPGSLSSLPLAPTPGSEILAETASFAALSRGHKGVPSHLPGRTSPSPWERPLPTLPTSTFARFRSFLAQLPSLPPCPHTSPWHQPRGAEPSPRPPSELVCDTSGRREEGKTLPESPKSLLQALQRVPAKGRCGNSCPGNAGAHPAAPSGCLGRLNRKAFGTHGPSPSPRTPVADQ